MGYASVPTLGQRYQDGGGGYAEGRFLSGIGNPSVGGQSVQPPPRHPTGRVLDGPSALGGPGSDYGLPVDVSRGPGPKYIPPTGPYTGSGEAREPGPSAGRTPDRSLNKGGSSFVWDKGPGTVDFNEPDIPGMRDAFEIERYLGEKWAPSKDYESSVVDTGALVEATDKLLQERMGGEMAEAARRFGQAGALMSGGGLGGGYAGTLAESERGYRRDYGEMANRYRFQAEQADADRQRAAYDAAMDRELRGHEGYEDKRLRDIEMANKYGTQNVDRETDYDWDVYGAEVAAANREQQDAIRALLDQYGG